jgi:hypothetical protein
VPLYSVLSRLVAFECARLNVTDVELGGAGLCLEMENHSRIGGKMTSTAWAFDGACGMNQSMLCVSGVLDHLLRMMAVRNPDFAEGTHIFQV